MAVARMASWAGNRLLKDNGQWHPSAGGQPGDGPTDEQPARPVCGAHDPGTQARPGAMPAMIKGLRRPNQSAAMPERQADDGLPQAILGQDSAHQGQVFALALDIGGQSWHV